MSKINYVIILSMMACLLASVPFNGCSPAQPMPNSISGHVYQSDGKTPIAGARIEVSNNQGIYWVGETFSAADGSYILTGLPPGEYLVHAAADYHVLTYYTGALSYPGQDAYKEAAKVTVLSGEETTGIDFALPK